MRITITLCLFCMILLVTYFSIGCSNHKADIVYPCDTTIVRYNVEIKNILDDHCQNCHGADPSQNANSFGINLYDYSTISSLALDVSHCSIGQLMASVSHDPCTDPSSFMPKGQPKISDCEISKIRAWVNKGAPNN